MPRVNAPVYSLNGGEVGNEPLARLDLERLQFAGSLYSNILPRVVGSMTLRPGLEHVADIGTGNVELLEYAYAGASTLIPILSSAGLRVIKDNAFVSRLTVGTTIASGAVVPRQPGRKFVCYTKCSTFWKLSVSRQLRRERRSQDEPTRVPLIAF